MKRHVAALVLLLNGACGGSTPAPEATVAPETARFQGQPPSYWIEHLADNSVAARRRAITAIQALGPSAAAAIPTLKRLIADPAVRDGAFGALAAIGEAALPTLLRLALTDADEQTRKRAAAAMRRASIVDAAVDSLIARLDSDSQDARIAALSALINMESSAYRAIPALIGLLKDTSEPVWRNRIRAAAVNALTQIGAPTLQALSAELNDPDLDHRRLIVYVITTVGEPALPTLMQALETQPETLRVYVVTMIGGNATATSIGEERGANALSVALRNDMPEVRRAAAIWLGMMGHDRSVAWEALREATNDPEERVRIAASETYANLATGPDRNDIYFEAFADRRRRAWPAVTAIRSGEVIRFHNRSAGPHRVVFRSGDHDRESLAVLMKGMPDNQGLTGALIADEGEVYQVSFADVPPGTYQYSCALHPTAVGRVHVVPSN